MTTEEQVERLVTAAMNGTTDPPIVAKRLWLWQAQTREFARLRAAIEVERTASAERIRGIEKKIADAQKKCHHPVRDYQRMDAQSHPTNVCVICGHDSEDGDKATDRASQPVNDDLQHVLEGVEVLCERRFSEDRRERQCQQKGVQSQARRTRAEKGPEHVRELLR